MMGVISECPAVGRIKPFSILSKLSVKSVLLSPDELKVAPDLHILGAQSMFECLIHATLSIHSIY